MKQKIWSGLVAALFASTVGVTSSSKASQDQAVDPSQAKATPEAPTSTQPSNVVKMGERQSQESAQGDGVAIARIQPHTLAGRDAVTLYVQDIPVLTFLDSRQPTAGGVKVATVNLSDPSIVDALPKAIDVDNPQDPVWRATTVAAKLNQMSHEGFDPKTIQAAWDAKQKQYVVRTGSKQLVALAQTTPPGKSGDPAADALQITNLLRRQFGAPALKTIPGKPKLVLVIRRAGPKGVASWYGPGFHGRQTASGERFNQFALTAAHRSLPFGTQVRVTNIRSGRSVVVRINDRGPHIRGRIIDLSKKAAQVLGVFSQGSAPVQLDVLN